MSNSLKQAWAYRSIHLHHIFSSVFKKLKMKHLNSPQSHQLLIRLFQQRDILINILMWVNFHCSCVCFQIYANFYCSFIMVNINDPSESMFKVIYWTKILFNLRSTFDPMYSLRKTSILNYVIGCKIKNTI